VPKIVTTHLVRPDQVDHYLRPRADLVVERPDGPEQFALVSGPFDRYRRSVQVRPVGDPAGDPAGDPSDRSTGGGAPSDDERMAVVETVDYHLAIPVWRPLFALPVRGLLRQPHHAADDPTGTRPPWWAPPDHFDARASVGLSLLCVFAVLSGYLGTLLTQTNTYFRQDFGVSNGAVGVMLAATRVGALLALAIVALADRRGRRSVLVLSAVAGCLLTATAALGAGICVMLLKLADLGAGAWRILYVLPLLAVPASLRLGRRIPETERYERHLRVSDPTRTGRATTWRQALASMDRGRLALLSATGFLLALFVIPASSFLNDFLRTDRGFSTQAVIAFQILTNTPGGVGIVVGGRLADVRGRRLIGSIGIAGGTVFTVLMFVTAGPQMWLWSLLGTVIGAIAVPALAVYGPELFPTESRGLANGLINLFAVLGSAAGLALAGWLSDRAGGLGTAMVVLAVGPLVVVGLILVLFPETAAVELEALNPLDQSESTRDGPDDPGSAERRGDPGPTP
jgi:MFS family permease